MLSELTSAFLLICTVNLWLQWHMIIRCNVSDEYDVHPLLNSSTSDMGVGVSRGYTD